MKEFGPIDHIDFSPIEPYHFAVTCSVRVQIYNPITKLVVKNLSRFRENAYGATFRSDGKLLCAGGEETNVKLFDVASKSLLRLFKGHTAAVHRTQFLYSKPQIASFSDDKSVKIWDIPTETNVISYSEHNDYVRAGTVNPILTDLVLSGSYDNTVKMFDTRTEKAVITVNHGSPIESILFLPSGSIFLSAGGTDIKIWDTIAGGKLLGSISQHHKTITCLRLASNNKRLMSASLDRHVKIYDLNTYKVVHTLDYPNAVLSLGVSKTDDTVVAGLVDGLVSIRRMEDDRKPEKDKKKVVSYKYSAHSNLNSVDEVVAEKTVEKQSKHDYCLRKFQYSKALDVVLAPYTMSKSPEITAGVMHELMRRKALDRAFRGRDTKSISQILRFFNKYITDYRFTRILIDAVHIFLDVYEDKIATFPADIGVQLVNLNKLLEQELKLADQLGNLQGSMQLLLAGASAGQDYVIKENALPLTPSVEAQKNLVVNLT